MLTESNKVATGEFFFCPGQKTAAAVVNNGFKHFGNLDRISINPVIETNEHDIPRRGINTRGKTHVTKVGLMIQAEMFDITWDSISTLFGSEAEYGGKLEDGASGSAAAGADIVVPSTLPDGIAELKDLWFQITNGSAVPFTNITAATLNQGGVLVEGTDYELNARTGQVRFISSEVSLGETVTVTGVDAGGTATARLQGDVVGQSLQKEGMGQLAIFGSEGDANNQVYAELIHENFLCKVYIDGNDEIDPNSPQNITLNIKVLDVPGKFWLRTNP